MRALTLYRPWPWAIFHLGPKRAKRVENRTWPPPKSIVGERIAIHAGARFDHDAVGFIARAGGERPPEPTHHLVGIVGVARVVGYCEPSAAPRSSRAAQRWYMGGFGWFLDDVVALDAPIECRGSRRLWEVPRDVEQQILAQLAKKGL